MFFIKENINSQLLNAIIKLSNDKEITVSKLIEMYNDRWITVHPPKGDKSDKGVPVQIDEQGTIQKGLGGKHTGKKISQIRKTSKQEPKKVIAKSTEGIKKEKETKITEKKFYQKSKEILREYLKLKEEATGPKDIKDAWHREQQLATKWYDAVQKLSLTIDKSIPENKYNTHNFFRDVSLVDISSETNTIKKESKEVNEMYQKLMDMYGKSPASEYNKLRWEYIARRNSLEEKKEKIRRRYSEKVSNYLKKLNNSNFEVKVEKTTLKDVTKLLQDTLNGCLSSDWNSSSKLTIKKQAEGKRANYALGTIKGNNSLRTMIHEYAHYLEDNNPRMLANSLAFLEYRTKGEQEKSLDKLTNLHYTKGERAKADKFFDPYCGKIYKDSNFGVVRLTASEIMSMGMQELFTNPIEFAEKDPEYFNFVIANMRGEL